MLGFLHDDDLKDASVRGPARPAAAGDRSRFGPSRESQALPESVTLGVNSWIRGIVDLATSRRRLKVTTIVES